MKRYRCVILSILFLITLIGSGIAWHQVGKHEEKLWLHRCNSIEKMEEQEDIYNNIEVDLVYRGNGVFDVTHDADTTFGLRVDSFLDEVGHEEDKHMWMDIKNVTLANCHQMHEDLDSLCETYQVDKDQLIIEGKSWKALEEFTKDDYYTSFYVSFQNPKVLSDEEIDDCIDSLQYIADTKKVSALSFPSWWYNEIKEDLHRSIDSLTWKHRTTQWQFFMSPTHFKMMNDSQLKVILMKSKGQYHR